MSLKDYTGRKYDYLSFRGVKPTSATKLDLELFTPENNGQICVGIQKLAQRWLLEFLTALGSMPGRPTRGSTFIAQVKRGQLFNQIDVSAAFASDEIDIRNNLRNEEYAGMPDDEKIDNAQLLSSASLPGYLQLYVKITSRAGTSREIILPISMLPQNNK